MISSATSSSASPVWTRRQVLAVLLATVSSRAFAQSERPVRLIVPTSAGSSTDAVARALQPGLAAALDVPVVVEDLPGASGVIGLQALSRTPPNRTALVVITNSLVTTPAVMKAFPFDVSKDFTPIALVSTLPMVLAVNAARVPATDANEFVALLKSTPDQLVFGSSGVGSLSHLASEMFLDQAGAKARHIPYQGPSPMAVALIGGQIDFTVVGLSVLEQHIKSGVLRAIGACTARRTAVAPDIPTFVEQGMPNYVAEAWVTVLGPKGMQPALVKKVHDALATAVTNPTTKDALTKQGNVINLTTSAEAQETIRHDLAMYASLVKKIGLQSQ